MPSFKSVLFVCCVTSLSLNAAPKRFITKAEKSRSAIDEIHTLIDDVRYESANHEAELRCFEEKLNNQELALDSLWKQMNDSSQNSREQVKNNIKSVQDQVATIESKAEKASTDVQQLKKHANESTDTLGQYQKKIASLEKAIDVMGQNIEHMHSALKSLMDALHIKDVAIEIEKPSFNGGGNTYRVKAGDSLEKIARRNNVSLHKLREANNITGGKDLIIVGQSLKIPTE
jgi:chromosome segregation ATPase